MRPLRHQLPVHSPLPLRALAGAIGGMRGDHAALERDLADRIRERYSARDVVLTNSGTSALRLALEALHRAGRGPVAMPAYACFDIATAAVGAGIGVRLYDVDPETLGPDPHSLRAALAQGARSIVVAYLYGYPVDLNAVNSLAAEYGALMIEDAAQGAGGTWQGVPLGSFGAASILSFGRGKGTTGGGGGALLWRHDAEAALGAAPRPTLRTGGARPAIATAAQWLLARPAVYGLPAALPFLHLGDTVFKEPTEPARLPRFSTGLVARTWQPSGAAIATRRTNAARLLRALEPASLGRSPRAVSGGEPGYLRLPVLARDSAAARFRETYARRLGIMPGYPVSLDRLEEWAGVLRNSTERMPGATLLAASLFTLPTHGMLADADLVALEGWLRR